VFQDVVRHYWAANTRIQEVRAERELYQSLGQTTASLGAANLATSGSGLDILRESAAQGAATAAIVKEQGLIQTAGYKEQQQSYQQMASAMDVAASADNIAASVASSPAPSGTVKFYNGEKGFGFIACDDGSELFFHVSRWPIDIDPVGQERVSFDISFDRNGRKRADRIVVL
jgi:CspA family cold shock protein